MYFIIPLYTKSNFVRKVNIIESECNEFEKALY
jgi:hypothetical protein